jgi:hypothetical protein
LRATNSVAPSTSRGAIVRSVGEPMRVCRLSWIFSGVSGSPVTIHSAPELKTWRCRPENTARIALI